MKGKLNSNMDILAQDKTLTSQFLLPLLFEDKKFTKVLTDYKSFINAYIADFDKPQNDNKIIVVFNKKQKDLPEINQVDHYTRTVKDEVLHFYVYDIPIKYEESYVSWLIGRYSLFTEEAKQTILKFWGANKNTLLYGVLYKTGDKIRKFYKEHFDKDFSEKWTDPQLEWWFDPVLPREIFGAE